jgi:hypothetical protein
MARLQVAIEFNDGTKKIYPVTPKVEVEFERHYGVGLGKAFTDQRKEYLHHLGWMAQKASGEVVKVFDLWLDGIADTDVVLESTRPTDATA